MRGKVLAVVLACLFALSAAAQSASDRDADSKIRALETVWDRAEEKGDIGALNLIFDRSMIYIDEDGSLLTKAQFLNRARNESGSYVQWLSSSIVSVKIYGDTAVVVGNYTVKGVHGGKPRQWSGRFIDTWTLRAGIWLCVVAQSTPVLR